MEKPMSRVESYVNRRKLFRDIWQTVMSTNDLQNLTKTKVIKTLRLEDIDSKIHMDKRCKQRIKNLRTVCNKLLEFCDTQDGRHGNQSPNDTVSSPEGFEQKRAPKQKKRRIARKKKEKSSSEANPLLHQETVYLAATQMRPAPKVKKSPSNKITKEKEKPSTKTFEESSPAKPQNILTCPAGHKKLVPKKRYPAKRVNNMYQTPVGRYI